MPSQPQSAASALGTRLEGSTDSATTFGDCPSILLAIPRSGTQWQQRVTLERGSRAGQRVGRTFQLCSVDHHIGNPTVAPLGRPSRQDLRIRSQIGEMGRAKSRPKMFLGEKFLTPGPSGFAAREDADWMGGPPPIFARLCYPVAGTGDDACTQSLRACRLPPRFYLLIRIFRYSTTLISDCRAIGPVSGRSMAASRSSPLQVQRALLPVTTTSIAFQSPSL
jgi:hypothetical protein